MVRFSLCPIGRGNIALTLALEATDGKSILPSTNSSTRQRFRDILL